jgi:DNA-binding transcriptional LysR family regulator
MSLDPRQLRAFLAVVETGSLGRAAEALHFSEPAVSRIIKRLEAQLHVQLFERRTTGMELTSFGHALLPYANRLSTEATHAIDEIDALRGLDRGTLRIGAVASAAVIILPAVLDRILARSPGLQIQITEAVEDKLAQALANNAIDIVLSGAIPGNPDIIQVGDPRFSDNYRVIASATHPLLDRKDLTIRDLHDMEWVMPPEDAEPRRLFNSLLEQLNIAPPRVRVETRSPAAIKAMVARTQFLGWLPEPLFAAERAAGLISLLPVKELNVHRRFYVYRRRQNFMSPPVLKFLEALRNTDVPS